jgi:hypothetical protein
MFKQFFRFVRPGWVRLEVDGPPTHVVAAFRSPDSRQVAVVVLNPDRSARAIQPRVSGNAEYRLKQVCLRYRPGARVRASEMDRLRDRRKRDHPDLPRPVRFRPRSHRPVLFGPRQRDCPNWGGFSDTVRTNQRFLGRINGSWNLFRSLEPFPLPITRDSGCFNQAL